VLAALPVTLFYGEKLNCFALIFIADFCLFMIDEGKPETQMLLLATFF
jgi:hypothetical protein